MKLILTVIPAVIVFLLYSCTSQKNSSELKVSSKLLNAPSDFFSQPDKYFEWQAGNMLDVSEKALLRYPPQEQEPIERRMAMMMLDAVFHDVSAPNRPSVQEFHKKRTLHALDEMKKTTVKKGALIWKLYDMAVIFRTKSATVAFDLVRGKSAKSDQFMIPDSMMNEIIGQCDILFISHNHQDHADEWAAQRFIEQGKSVIAPDEIFKNSPFHSRITHLKPEIDKIQSVPVRSGKANLEVVIYPGHQGNLNDNVTVVRTQENITLCQTGDESLEADFTWVDKVHEHFNIDVLIPNCWTPDPLRVAKGYDPRLIIPAHENELGHTVDHREAYALDYSRWNTPYPKLIMTWGESFHYKP
jgi:L-ascorbate metabolism protein UlaG (beta-lactamase superfamily)